MYRASSVCGATHVTIAALFCSSSLLRSSNCVWAAEYETGQSVSANGNEESTGENCHLFILVLNAITPYSCKINLQYILLGDYWECVWPARLSVLTRVTSSVLPGNNIWDTFLIGSATDTTTVYKISPHNAANCLWFSRQVLRVSQTVLRRVHDNLHLFCTFWVGFGKQQKCTEYSKLAKWMSHLTGGGAVGRWDAVLTFCMCIR